MVNARHYTASETLKDGRPILIRAIRPDDKDALTAGFARLSEDTVYRRFLHNKRDITHQELDDYTDLDFVNHVGLVAVVDEGSQEHIIGGGRYIGFCDKAGKSHAELAFTVVDAYQGLRLATHFLQHLTRIGQFVILSDVTAMDLHKDLHMSREHREVLSDRRKYWKRRTAWTQEVEQRMEQLPRKPEPRSSFQ